MDQKASSINQDKASGSKFFHLRVDPLLKGSRDTGKQPGTQCSPLSNVRENREVYPFRLKNRGPVAIIRYILK